MTRWLLGGAALAAIAIAGWQGVNALQQNDSEPQSTAANASVPATLGAGDDAAARAAATPQPRVQAVTRLTPMAERVAVIGVLNKRNGIARDLTMKPGQALRWGNVIVRLRACEQTAPWEPEMLTGAFLQVDVQNSRQEWRRVFSGWVYKESPSLNAVEHPIYDVWTKACAMKFPDTAPGTVTLDGARAASNRSSAKKSGDETAAPSPDDAVPPPSAVSSNAT